MISSGPVVFPLLRTLTAFEILPLLISGPVSFLTFIIAIDGVMFFIYCSLYFFFYEDQFCFDFYSS